MVLSADQDLIGSEVVNEVEGEGVVEVGLGPVEPVADHLKSHVLVSVGSLNILIRDGEPISVGVGEFESGDLHVDHVEGVTKALLNGAGQDSPQGGGPVHTDLLGLLLRELLISGKKDPCGFLTDQANWGRLVSIGVILQEASACPGNSGAVTVRDDIVRVLPRSDNGLRFWARVWVASTTQGQWEHDGQYQDDQADTAEDPVLDVLAALLIIGLVVAIVAALVMLNGCFIVLLSLV